MNVFEFLLHRYPFIRGRTRLTQLLSQYSRVGAIVQTRDGAWFRILDDPMSRGIDLFGECEPPHTRLYTALVAPGDTVVEVGANFGWYTVLFAKLVGSSGRLITFEPTPSLAECVRESMRLNSVESVATLVESGLGRDAGETATVCADAIASTCKVQRLDEYLKEADIDRVDLIKIDAACFAADVLTGAPNLLARTDAPIVAFDINPERLKLRGIPLNAAQRVLADAGYTEFIRLLDDGRTQEGFPVDSAASVYGISARPARAEQLRVAVGRIRQRR